MNPREDVDGLDRPFAHRLSAMIDARLLTYREWMPWTDSLILSLDAPPVWILDLAVVKYYPEAVRIVNAYVYAGPPELSSLEIWTDEYIASLYLRYERRELSWATFLEHAGQQSDANGGRYERFYVLLNAYEIAGFSEQLEWRQRAEVLANYEGIVDSVRRTFTGIMQITTAA